VHVVSILGALSWAIGLTGWRPGNSTATGTWLASAAGRVALVGVAVLAVQFSLDGIGMEALVALWSRPDSPTGVFEAIAAIAPEALVGTALIWLVLLYGLTPILAGSSIVLGRRPILGWTGIALGSYSAGGGLILALGIGVVPDWLVFAGATIGVNLWVVALGVTLWRASDIPDRD
jgi:hypothetical protein